MEHNPYTLVFGKEPAQRISRMVQLNTMMDTFLSEEPAQQVYIITGVRGSGKTVLMTEVSRKMREEENWIVVELNPERDMLKTLASKLSSEHRLASIFKNASINLSFFGFGLEVENTAPVTDIEAALSKMLSSLRKHGKRVLVTVDEVVSNQNMKTFASSFQIFVRQDLPLFLLMTGLYENVHVLQNEKSLTFLYRAPKIELKPLNIGTIAQNYGRIFHLDEDEALKMAQLTRGYSFAFQILGYFTWEYRDDPESVMTEYKQYLEDYAYDKIWSELSQNDRKVAYGIAKSKSGKISEIRQLLGYETNQFNPYRKRLIKKGIINGDVRGYVSFTLPLFEKYVMENYFEM